MTPFTRRLDPGQARFLESTCRAVAAAAGIFCVAVSTLLIANAVQLSTLNIRDNPALTALRERYRDAQDDDGLAAEIRALDLLARKAYFTRRWQVRTAAAMLAAGAALLIACLRAAAYLSRRLPRPGAEAEEPLRAERRAGRAALAGAGALLFIAAMTASALGLGALAPELAPAAAPRAGDGKAPARAGAGVTATGEFRANWPQFRGPDGNGIAASREPPLDWDGPSGRNILWKMEVPRPGFGSPVVWGDRVFLSGADASVREVFCWEAGSGRLLWRRVIEGVSGSPTEAPKVFENTGFAAPTMAVDGKAAYAVFANGDMAAVDFDGNILWKRNLGRSEQLYGYASSPAQYGGSLIVQFDQEDTGRLLAVDAATGRTRWETPRRVLASYASPVVVSPGGRAQILVSGTPILAAYDPERGKQLWQVEGMTGEIGSSPAFAEGRVIANDQLLKILAFDVVSRKVLWEYYDDLPDVASPLAFGEWAVAATSYGVAVCLEAASGKLAWKREFETGFYASPVLAGDRIHLMDRSGTMRIIASGPEGKVLGSPALGEAVDATPAFVGSRIYVRGVKHLFCIGAQGG